MSEQQMDAQNQPRKKIVFAPVSDKAPPHEQIRSDVLLVNPDYFKGLVQKDGNLCAYITFAAQIHMCQPNQENAVQSQALIKRIGVGAIAELIRKQIKSSRLDRFTASHQFESRCPNTNFLTGLSGYKHGQETAGEAIARMIREDHMLPSIIIEDPNDHTNDHAVLGIGVSGDNREIITIDAKYGTGNPKIRRLSVSDPNIGVQLAAKVNPVFMPST